SQVRTGTNVTLPTGVLQNDTTYYWTVRAVGAGGETPGVPGVMSFRTRMRTDLNGDGAVGATDLATLLSGWGPHRGAGDVNGDGVVDAIDLSLLLGDWN